MVADGQGYADILRVVGQLLDTDAATDVEIIEHETFIALSWRSEISGAETRSFRELDIARLRKEARQRRGTGAEDHPRGYAELLRTLGQELDDDGITLNSIVEEEDGYRVSSTAGRRYDNRLYTWTDLHAASVLRRAQRRAPQELTPHQFPSEPTSTGPSYHPKWAFWRHGSDKPTGAEAGD
jgi:hypothetical protein